MMPGARYARILMIIVAVVVTAALVIGVIAAPITP